ncbi:MAG: mono/diheme cytochrome c family protein [Hyphomicrobiaceae bacterium]|jgi:mono/diheme cytochrome c family protein
MGRGYVEEEEKRSYGAVFLLTIALLLACTVWALWQDSFSRHLWKQYKTDFYQLAIDKWEGDLEQNSDSRAANEDYIALSEKLEAVQASIADGSDAERLAAIDVELDRLAVEYLESDLSLRIVKGEVEEGWYRLELAQHSHLPFTEERKTLNDAFVRRDEYQARFDAAKAAIAKLEAEGVEIRSKEIEIEEQLKAFHKADESLQIKLDSVSMNFFGSRVPLIPTIDQAVLWGFERNNFEQWVNRAERCQNCHMGIDREGFEDQENPLKTHPDRKYFLGNHEFRRFGCTPCHGGQGAAINSVWHGHGEDHYWEDHLLPIEDKVQAKCLTCHQSVQKMKGAEVAARGEWLFQEMGCHNCHLVNGFEHLDKAGPSLKRVAAKVSPEWLVSWIENPKEFRPRTRMPHFFVTREEATSIASYIIDSSFDDGKAWLAGADEPVGVDPGDAELVDEGRGLTESLGCLGCHGFEPDAYASQVAQNIDTAPNLSRIAEKTDSRWIYNWIRDPRGYSEHARMPSLRLTDEEAVAITSYLATLKQEEPLPADPALRAKVASRESLADGERLVRRYGCFGCHVVNGMEAESRIGVELSSFGGKHVEELFFGDRLDIPATWDDWTINKILTPRTYATERIEQVMPEFGFTHDDARALTVFLSSRTDHVVSEKYKPDAAGAPATLRRGREVVARYNCQGCHSFDGLDGSIREHFENLENAPPVLTGEGLKLQPEWFFDFLMKPVRLRPWLDVRMPSFGLRDDEATAIVDYFAALEGFDLGSVVLEAGDGAGPAMVRTHSTIPDGAFDCYACHTDEPRGTPKGVYGIAKTGLPDSALRSWVAEHLGLGGDGDPETDGGEAREASIREYLGASEN